MSVLWLWRYPKSLPICRQQTPGSSRKAEEKGLSCRPTAKDASLPGTEETNEINPCVIPNSLEDFGMFLCRNPPQLRLLCVPEPSRTSSAICLATLRNLISFLVRNPSEPHQLSAPEPSGTSSGFYMFLHQNLPEPCLLSTPEHSEPCLLYAPEPTGTRRNLISFLHGTLRNLISFLHRNPPPEPCLLSTPEPSGTSSTICTGTVRNFVCYLHQNRPEPHQPSTPEPSGTFRNLLRNLGLQLHRIAPELFWARDPIASFAVGEKKLRTCWKIDGKWMNMVFLNTSLHHES